MTDKLIDQAFQSWANFFRPFASTTKMDVILHTVLMEGRKISNVVPANNQVFRCFKECQYSDFKVLFLGIEPFINGGACGLAYAVESTHIGTMPAANKNLLIELKDEYPDSILDPSLSTWSKQGILLYSSALTTVEGKTRAHINEWRPFTQYFFKELSERNTGIIYVLLGKEGQEYASLINAEANYILKYPHPASENTTKGNSGFFDSGIFLDINAIHKKLYGYELIF